MYRYVNWPDLNGEHFLRISSDICISLNPEIPLLDTYPKETLAFVCKEALENFFMIGEDKL